MARKSFDIAIVGAGILGVTTAFWISQLYDCTVAILDQAGEVAFHTSSRNTGVIHRPFYLNPKTKRVFAFSAERSYPLWKELARSYGLPWKEIGTIEVAYRESDLPTLGDLPFESGFRLETRCFNPQFHFAPGSFHLCLECFPQRYRAIDERDKT